MERMCVSNEKLNNRLQSHRRVSMVTIELVDTFVENYSARLK